MTYDIKYLFIVHVHSIEVPYVIVMVANSTYAINKSGPLSVTTKNYHRNFKHYFLGLQCLRHQSR